MMIVIFSVKCLRASRGGLREKIGLKKILLSYFVPTCQQKLTFKGLFKTISLDNQLFSCFQSVKIAPTNRQQAPTSANKEFTYNPYNYLINSIIERFFSDSVNVGNANKRQHVLAPVGGCWQRKNTQITVYQCFNQFVGMLALLAQKCDSEKKRYIFPK